MARFFTSDLHFSDNRFSLFNRPFKNLDELHEVLIKNWNDNIKEDDEVWFLGDFSTTDEGVKFAEKLNGKKHLIIGNYDEGPRLKLLKKYFKTIQEHKVLVLSDGEIVHLNHYPAKASNKFFNIVGHIHGTWKVQRNMINVGVDAWHFLPVPEEKIIWQINGIRKHYDEHVFAGELPQNFLYQGAKVIYTGEEILPVGKTIFLAGPTPRNKETESWRPEFIEKLKKAGFNGTILTPELKDFEDKYNYDKQVTWETDGLRTSDLIVFWVPRELKEMPGFTTNVEYGRWIDSGKIVLGYPKSAEKMQYLDYIAKDRGVPVYTNMNKLIEYIVDKTK